MVPYGPTETCPLKSCNYPVLHLISTAGPLVTDHIKIRANILTIMETKNNTNPISIKDDKYMLEAASANSLASTLAKVYPGENNDAVITAVLPIIMVTAMVSPMARPKAKITAPKIPALP